MTILAGNARLTKCYKINVAVVKKFYPTMDKFDIPNLEMSTSWCEVSNKQSPRLNIDPLVESRIGQGDSKT